MEERFKREYLIESHNKAKNHPFREHYLDNSLLGTWKAEFSDYLRCLIDLAYSISGNIWRKCYTKDEQHSKELADIYGKQCQFETAWLHDFIGMFSSIRLSFSLGIKDHNDDIVGKSLTRRDIYAATGLNDIIQIMQYLDTFIGYCHRYIETGILDEICFCEPVYEDGEKIDGYYYRHMTTGHKNEKGDNWILSDFKLINKK